VSSLRPLITIMLLAAVGVVLYMKINETEPAIPAGVGEWTAGPLDIGAGNVPGAAAAPTTLPPAYEAEGAPPFVPASAASSKPKPAGGDAPSWSPGPVAVSEPSKKTDSAGRSSPSATDPESSPVARTAEPEVKLPEMPPLPDTSAAKDATDTAASTTKVDEAPPFTPTANEAAATAQAEPSDSSITPTEETPNAPTKPTQAAMFPAARVAVQGALERGELGQALLMLTDWYDDPSLTPEESQEVSTLLSQLAGSVIYEGPPAHVLERPYIVQSGETLHDVAAKYDVPWQLLAKINGVADPSALQPGQELKVVRGPFSALVDLSERKMTLMLDRRYAGRFAIELDPAATIEEGQWKVDQKLLTPAGGGLYGSAAGPGEDRSLLLSNPANPTGQAIVLRGPGSTDPASAAPAGRVIRMKSGDVNDLYDILSEKSRVTVRR